MLLDYYTGRTILIPGGAGLLGTALCYKLISAARPEKIYVLIRGKEERLWTQWRSVLPDAQYNLLRSSSCIIPISGDASIPNSLGLPEPLLTTLRETVTVIINLACRTQLRDNLTTIKATNIDPALCVAEVATTFLHLERFVWMSSAYANDHLHWRDPNATLTAVGEVLYPLSSNDNPETELAEIESSGESEAYRQNFFSSEYSYAKHLTERLLLSRFRLASTPRLPHLLIIRPSCIGPSLRSPSPSFEILGSTPITTLMSVLIYGSAHITGSHPLPTRNNTGFKTLVNECPVDLVTNRILALTSYGTQGIAHAVVSGASQLTFGDYWNEYISTVPYAVQPQVEWVDDKTLLAQFHARANGSSPNTHAFAEEEFGSLSHAFPFVGASYMFSDRKTTSLWQTMDAAEKEQLPLMVDGKDELLCALKTRKKRSTAVISRELTKYGFFSSPKAGKELFDGHLMGNLTRAPNGVRVQGVGKSGGAVTERIGQPGASMNDRRVGKYRFPWSQGGGVTVIGADAGVVSADVRPLIEGEECVNADGSIQGQLESSSSQSLAPQNDGESRESHVWSQPVGVPV